MASILSSVGLNQSDIIIDKQLSVPYGGGGSGGAGGTSNSSGGTGSGDASANFTTGTPPGIWFSYNSSSTHTIENSNASRHFADHPESSGAVGMEAIIIVVVVSLIPVSVIACMVFVISFNCLKRRSSLWSTTASPNATENNFVAKAQAQVTRVDGSGGPGNRRMSAIHLTTDNERSTDADLLFNSERGQHDDQSTMIDNTPLSLIYPADGFCSAYLDTSKSSLTTPISNNSVITMTMRNNHLIVETEERIPCLLLDGQHLYGGDGAQNTSSIYAQCQVEDYELNDDSLLDETDSFCENRYCQHGSGDVGGTACVTENGCAFCDDYDDDEVDDEDDQHHNVVRNLADGAKKAFYDTAAVTATAAHAILSTTDSRSTRMQTDEEDQHVQFFHKNIATGEAERQRQPVQHGNGSGGSGDDNDASCSYECGREKAAAAVTINTGYSQSDAGDSSRHAHNHYVYGNQSEYVTSTEPARNKPFASSRRRWPVSIDTDARIMSTMTSSTSCSAFSHSPQPQPQPQPPTNSVHLRSIDSDDRST